MDAKDSPSKYLNDEKREQERRALYWLCEMPFLGAVSIAKLGAWFGGFANLINIEEIQLLEAGILRKNQISSLLEWRKNYSESTQRYEQLKERGIQFVTPLDDLYPKRLRNIYSYPMGLFVRGMLPKEDKPVLAIVGARGCSAYGEQIAREFARTLSGEGVQIISGMALGIDGAAHQGAIDAGGLTYGVLGCGVNICYPPSHYRIYETLARSGGILSEFPLDTRPEARNFPMRNRIISGLSDAVLVVEAKARSGSLITAELGMEQGRDIFAVPGRITDRLSSGCNQLIADGAHMANFPKDILEFLGVKCQKELIIHEKDVNGLAKKEKMVYSCLDFNPKHLDDIMAASNLGLSECMGILLELELGGYIYRSANHYYGKKLD